MYYYFITGGVGGFCLVRVLQLITCPSAASRLNKHFKQILHTHKVLYALDTLSYLTIVLGQNNLFRLRDLQFTKGFFFGIFIVQEFC